ncbi:MAG: ScyD/ScyE family protein [Ardenticatenaceae bacterium]|nr:ScyD/ScyE family protein [Ardenticatenaceae bacterium]
MLKQCFIPLFLVLFAACQTQTATSPDLGAVSPTTHVLADGLINPIGLAQLPDGGLLIAEMGTGTGDDSAGVTLITAEGQRGRLISGIPSTRDSGDLAGAPLVGIAPDGRILYIGHFNASHLWTMPLEGPLALPDEALTTAVLGQAMFPQIIDQLINPFDIAFDATGRPVVTDASMNGIARPNDDGKTHFIHLFPRLPHPTDEQRTMDAVPTGIARFGDEFLVTLTGGCPFPTGGGQLVAVGQNGRARTVLTGLNMPIDVAVDENGRIWVLEFAQFREGGDCFAGGDYVVASGRLSRLDENGEPQPVVTDLNTPGAFLLADEGTVLISEVFAGRVLAIQLPAEAAWPISAAPPR